MNTARILKKIYDKKQKTMQMSYEREKVNESQLEEVLVDHEKLFKLRQEERIQNMMAHGHQYIKDLKRNKKPTFMNIQNQYLKYKDNLGTFYSNERVQPITEE